MQIIVGNSAAWWALLGIPLVLAIHFIQQRTRKATTSTLFLLEELTPLSARGRQIDWIRSSIPLWLQLLIVLLITAVLLEPKRIREGSVQRVVVLLDSSVSMLAFKTRLLELLPQKLTPLGQAASRTEWVVLETARPGHRLYTGGSLEDLTQAITSWTPQYGHHDIAPALELAQQLSTRSGSIVFISDHPQELPEGMLLLAVGRPLPNCGFAGFTIKEGPGGLRFSALVRNYAHESQTRSWWLEVAEKQSAPTQLTLAAGALSEIQASFPPGTERLSLHLEPDSFVLDDYLPIVRPRPAELTVHVAKSLPLSSDPERIFDSFGAIRHVAAAHEADLRVFSFKPTESHFPNGVGIGFLDLGSARKFRRAEVAIPERDRLVSHLRWDGVLATAYQATQTLPSDHVLVWQGALPLVLERKTESQHHLLFNFDVRASNVERSAAFILLLHRFVDERRASKGRGGMKNFETAQSLQYPRLPSLGLPVLRATGAHGLNAVTPAPDKGEVHAPWFPSFFEIVRDNNPILQGAAHFADTREADLSTAASADELVTSSASKPKTQSLQELPLVLLIILLMATLLLLWLVESKPRQWSNS